MLKTGLEAVCLSHWISLYVYVYVTIKPNRQPVVRVKLANAGALRDGDILFVCLSVRSSVSCEIC